MSALRHMLMASRSVNLTVAECIRLGYFTKDAQGCTLVREFPYDIDRILDFSDVFAKDTDENLYFINNDVNYLTTEQQQAIIDIINNKEYSTKELIDLKYRAFNLPNVDIKVSIKEYAYYHYNYDMFRGSTFNSVTIKFTNGNISSCNCLFRGSKVNYITFDTDFIAPRDISGMNEFNSNLKEFPNNIKYDNISNMGYCWELCTRLTEIPSYKTVTDEESRITTEDNIIGCNAKETVDGETIEHTGIEYADQAFNACNNLIRIGPVLDMKGIISYPYLMFGGCSKLSDIRIKNLNCNMDFATVLPAMDIDSIKYCIKNLYQQESDVSKTIIFGITYEDSITNKEIITSDMVLNANSKGWKIYCGETEIVA